MKNYKTPIILFAVFEIIAISLWLATGSLFYLLNFSYIGTIIGVGLALSKAGWKYAIGGGDADLRPLCKELNTALQGRGGGKPNFVQGSVAASRAAIDGFFAAL